MPPNTDIAWAAGFIDGEGTLAVYRTTCQGRSYTLPRVSAVQKARHVLDRLASILGCGKITSRQGPSGCFSWQANGKDAGKALGMLRPYLYAKRRQAAVLAAFIRFKRFHRMGAQIHDWERGIGDWYYTRIKDARHADVYL